MGDIGASVIVLDTGACASAKAVDNNNYKKIFGAGRGDDNVLSWQSVALLAASILLVLFAVSLWYPHSTRTPPEPSVDRHDSVLVVGVQPQVGGCDDKCERVTCRGFKSLEEMQKVVGSMKCQKPDGLFITSSSLGPVLHKDWLPTNVTVMREITLDNLDLTDIDADAFKGSQLSNVYTVVLSNLPNVTHLHRDIFRPFAQLGGIRLENLEGLVSVDHGIISDLDSRIFNDFQLTSLTTSIADLMPSFTGYGVNAPHLVKVQYAGNIGALRFEHLEGLNLDGVTQIYFMGAGITSIEKGALVRQAHGVQQLLLTSNKLTTISRDAIDISKFGNNSVFLEGNQWDCTCPLAWLLDFKDRINDNPECSTPEELVRQKIKDLTMDDLCMATVTPTPPEETTTTDPGTTPPATTAPPEEPTSPPVKPPESCTRGNVTNSTDHPNQILTETPDGEVLVMVPDLFRNQILEWSGNDGKCYWVDVGDRRAFVVLGLHRSTSYTFCFLDGAAVVISRCFPITLLPDDDQRPWLTNGVKTYVILGIVLGCLAAALIPGSIIVVAVRHRPRLLGGHIIQVGWHRPKEKVLVMPHGYRATSPRASTCAGSDSASYVTPARPTTCQLASYYVGRAGRRLGSVFRRRADEFHHAPPRRSSASTVTSDEGDFGAGRRCLDATEPPPAWYRIPHLGPWTSKTTLQVVRPRGVSSTSGI